jgi:hypothetical protein
MAPLRTMQAELRERLTSRLAVSQVFSQSGKSVSAGVGGSFQHGFTTIAVDYQNYYVPLRQPDPFMRALNLTVRLQLGGSSVNIGSTLDPFGRMTYSASGSTYLYVGEAAGAQPIAMRFERWVIRGRVVDEAGKPIDGAAVDLGGELAMTNSRGDFFLRTKHREAVPVKLSFDDFLAVGHYELVSAPERALPSDEDHAELVEIVVRSVGAAASPPDLHGLVQQGSVRGPLAPRGGGEPRDAPAAAPSRPLLALSAAAAIGQFWNAYAMLAEIGRAAVDAARLDCCRAREGWRLFERPLPIRRF